MTAYTLYNNVSHYSIEDVFDGDCYFICEFEHSNFDHSNGFSNAHRASLPTVESKYPTCIGCLHAEIQELESCVKRLTHLETICNTQHY
jgi:hypothetical protein